MGKAKDKLEVVKINVDPDTGKEEVFLHREEPYLTKAVYPDKPGQFKVGAVFTEDAIEKKEELPEGNK